MILCEEPWYNEPSYEDARGTPRGYRESKAYNRRVCMLTMRHALLDWAKSPPPNLWKDVVVEHFRRNGDAILETATKWDKENEGAPASPSLDEYDGLPVQVVQQMMHRRRQLVEEKDDTLRELESALRKYGATFEVPKK
jgi:hypothetical protein